MKILVLGAEGMIGSALMRHLPDALGATKRTKTLEVNSRLMFGVDISHSGDLARAFEWARPEVVINCAGIVKSECENLSKLTVRDVNGVAPHLIAAMAELRGCRVVQISTDCVFDGQRGDRVETDLPDAKDPYGQSKALGELGQGRHCVTLRTSFIGRDHVRKRGLLEWLLAQKDEALGYEQMFWSGLSTPELARAISLVLSSSDTCGLYHVSGPKISKADLLQVLIEAFGLPLQLRRVEGLRLDRSLDGGKFNSVLGYVPPSWQDMAKELASW